MMPFTYDDFEKKRTIGEGSFGKVVLGKNVKNNRDYAIKIINVKRMSVSGKRGVITEIRLLSETSHPHIVEYFGSFYHANSVFIVMKYCSGGGFVRLLVDR